MHSNRWKTYKQDYSFQDDFYGYPNHTSSNNRYPNTSSFYQSCIQSPFQSQLPSSHKDTYPMRYVYPNQEKREHPGSYKPQRSNSSLISQTGRDEENNKEQATGGFLKSLTEHFPINLALLHGVFLIILNLGLILIQMGLNIKGSKYANVYMGYWVIEYINFNLISNYNNLVFRLVDLI